MRVIVNLQIKKSKALADSKFPDYARCTMDGNGLLETWSKICFSY